MRIAKRAAGLVVGCVLLLSPAGAGAQDWPQWRGPHRDNKVTGFAEPNPWPKALTQKWRVSVGLGESSPVLAGDRVYAFGRQGQDEVTLCLDAVTGKEVWKDKYPAPTVTGPAKRFPGPRSTPAVAFGKVCTLGVSGVVSCLDAATGKVIWRKETGVRPLYYTSSSPLSADGLFVVFVGALTAYDPASGEAKWQWSGAGTPYGSPVLLTAGGTKQVVTPAIGALAGVRLSDGKLLWQVKLGKDYQSTFGTPIIDGQTVIYSASAKGPGSGTLAVKVEQKGDDVTAAEVWKKPLAAHKYHTPVLSHGLLFGVTTDLNFFCLDAKTGDVRWTDEGKQRGDCGSILDAGSVLLALTSDRDLVAFRPSGKGYEEVAKYRVADAETWAVPIVAGNRIYVRDKAGSLTLWTIE